MDDVQFKKGVFISQVNKLNQKFSSVNCSVKARLFQNYCCSFYGCQTWDLDSRFTRSLNTEWNKAVRRTLGLPLTTRTALLPLLINGKTFDKQHKSRMSKFLVTFRDSCNSHVSYIGARAQYYSHGPVGRNRTRCRDNMGVDTVTVDLRARSQVISELIDVRDGLKLIPGYTRDETIEFLDHVCTY